jgi:lipoprotein signal peptidase
MAEVQFPIIEPGTPVSWYQFAIDAPILTITVSTILAMAIGHIVTVLVCRRFEVPAQLPVTTLWLSFGVTAGLGMLRALPQFWIPILVAVSVFLVVWLMRDTNTEETSNS